MGEGGVISATVIAIISDTDQSVKAKQWKFIGKLIIKGQCLKKKYIYLSKPKILNEIQTFILLKLRQRKIFV